jgi:hypothetical protein
MRFPKLAGAITVKEGKGSVVIAGDPEGLRSLGHLLIWLADQDLGQWPYLKPGGHAHLHLYPKLDLGDGSAEVELMRLDAKGSAGQPQAG